MRCLGTRRTESSRTGLKARRSRAKGKGDTDGLDRFMDAEAELPRARCPNIQRQR